MCAAESMAQLFIQKKKKKKYDLTFPSSNLTNKMSDLVGAHSASMGFFYIQYDFLPSW